MSAVKKEVTQEMFNELFGASAAVLDQMFRGSHAPTRMQCVRLARELCNCAPHIVTDGSTFDFQKYAEDLARVVDLDDGYRPRHVS